jgi:hypothetical protein
LIQRKLTLCFVIARIEEDVSIVQTWILLE